jgi:hypothetical protein
MILRKSIEPEPEKTQLQKFLDDVASLVGRLLTWCKLRKKKS